MYIGLSIFLIASGAILRWAVTAEVSGVEVHTAGLILLLVGILGLVVSILEQTIWARRRGDAAVVREREYR